MKLSREQLMNTASATGFRPDVLEKAILLLDLLERLQDHPSLEGKLVLKGGTALNLFYFDMPRLSVDIDLNYIGAAGRETMLSERPDIKKAIQAVCSRESFTITRIPKEHAGGKWRLRYESATGEGGNLELDINYMYRLPLWPIVSKDSNILGSFQAKEIPLVDIHELAAGKLAALLARHQARDLFDNHRLLRSGMLDHKRIRLAFVVYGAMNRRDWRTVSIEDVDFEEEEIERQLVPTLNRDIVTGIESPRAFGTTLVTECKEALSVVLPFTEQESEFLDLLLDNGVIKPELLTSDIDMQERIASQPMLAWKALNVKQHGGEG
ncbi:MAG: nucleotidyl transferase AbiEii/AbiGii toxin family protein [Actinobacteria bacterium]|nr:nucleotidyl transferase AbiEii/AbiGii toxin family protein [Actinomycetota bacterium]MCG2819453.1 nucleotidyl transferase AbiEii/AbiGii toxin family protein [Actinomycetes bacterium]MBU4218956.1 nucleotidyl transferase AbiEii/AbiGii toxin family protein [Actinomycetota bacterium]MBU4358038.1 nucleotidyl transferase AbiEii/AbiGii toxin family protein [Actinomycetota bacterium]MBU4401454.1 nucleotidyl transferase AbiEii/AbiGii toxin family protein [Actinomycetota bacterium]